jgi:hypothetical protein
MQRKSIRIHDVASLDAILKDCESEFRDNSKELNMFQDGWVWDLEGTLDYLQSECYIKPSVHRSLFDVYLFSGFSHKDQKNKRTQTLA